MAKLTVSEQRAIIGERLLNSSDSELQADREAAMNAYYGRPYGNEIDGRAQVVSKDIMDTVEWIMPSMMRVFCVGEAVQFDPVGPEDEQLAKQETAFVTHNLWKKNPGFMIIYEWLKSALLQKNGYVKTWWQEEEKVCFEEYSGLTEEQLVQVMESLAQQGEVEITGQEVDQYGQYSIKAKVKKTYGCAKVEACPPEEVVVSRKCRKQIKSARFVGHLRRDVMRSELVEQGYPKAQVAKLTSYDYRADMAESMARDSVNETLNTDEDSVDDASGELELLECWTYLDADGDGIAELRHYLLAGNDELENEECPEIPFDSWTPTPVPFRHAGLSVYDLLEDLQRIKTALQRGTLDNVYFTMNPRCAYSRDTDVASLGVNRPGGHVLINVNGPIAGHILPMPVTPIVGAILPVISYIDQVKQTRTGVGDLTTGVDADVLAQSTKGAYTDARGAANQRIEAICRIFAETGYSALYSSLHRLLMRHQNWPERFKLKDQWVSVNPTEWQERANLTVSVGLGNASKDEVRQNLMLMGQGQQAAAMVPGLIQPTNVYALFRRMQVELGFENEDFITDPKSPQYQQWQQSKQGPPPDPYIEAEKIKAGVKTQENQQNAAIKIREQNQNMALEITKLEVESGIDLAKAGIGAEVAIRNQDARGNQQASSRSAAAAGKSPAAGSGGGP
jgi:hypothetical protein